MARPGPPAARRLTRCALLLMLLLIVVVIPLPGSLGTQPRPVAPAPGVWLEEVVTDPQRDRDGSGSTTSSDEYVVLWNTREATVDLAGWTLEMRDSTPDTAALSGVLAAGARHLVLNPPGQMNNDVTLTLRDAAGGLVDSLRLGTHGLPDGNADGTADEAVALAGPWAGHKIPASEGRGRAAVWVEALGRHGGPAAAAGASPWVAPHDVVLLVRAHVAPGAAGPQAVADAEGAWVPLHGAGPDVWRSDPWTPPPDGHVRIQAGALRVTHDGDALPLRVRIDTTPPVFAAEGRAEVVLNATRHVWSVPVPVDEESGIRSSNLSLVIENATVALLHCPADALPAAACRIEDENASVLVRAENGAGSTTSRVLRPHVDVEPPRWLDDWRLVAGTPPSLHWGRVDEPLSALWVESADDITGVWKRGRWALPLGNTSAPAPDAAPGEPRAYRLVAVDRAGNENATTWRVVENDTAHVAVAWQDLAEATRSLSHNGSAVVTVRIDRPLAALPHLEFMATSPRPALVEFQGVVGVDGRTLSFPVALPAGFPRTGEGTLRLVGGYTEDGIGLEDAAARIRWAAEAPRVLVHGAEPGWIPAVRHVVTLTPVAAGAETTVVWDPFAPGIEASRHEGRYRLVFTGQGLHEVRGNTTDGDGHRRPFMVRIALDATPPEVASADRPHVWNGSQPVRLDIRDAGAGVNASSLKVWARNATHRSEGGAVVWNGSQVAVWPAGDGLVGPFELHVAVADAAGNLAEGLVGAPLVARAAHEDAAASVFGATALPAARPAPAAVGPAWTVAAPVGGTGGAPVARGAPLWDPDEWKPRATASSVDASEGGSWVGPGLLSLGAAVGLGNAVRRVRRRRRQTPPVTAS